MIDKIIECRLLSPIHIGTGEAFNPTQYIIKRGRLFRLSVEKFLLNADFSVICQLEDAIRINDPVAVRSFIESHFNPETHALYSCHVSAFVEALYQQKRNSVDNQLEIFPFVRNGPITILPGSSLKGAIRTAVVSHMAGIRRVPIPRDFKEEKVFESRVLGNRDASDDPFRTLKIGDATLSEESTIVTKVINYSKNRKKRDSSMQLLYEISRSMITGQELSFYVKLRIDQRLGMIKYIKNPLSYEFIAEACNAFYKPKMEIEHNKFYRKSSAERYSEKLLNIRLAPNEFLLRIGRFCGVENVTLDKYRKPRPLGKNAVWGTTRNLADGCYPMGWVLCSI